MAGITKISELEARKRALVMESELCREAFKAEVANLQAYGAGLFKKVDRARSFVPWLMVIPAILPLFKLFTGRKPEAPQGAGMKGRLATLMLGLRLYRQYGPMLRSLAGQFMERRRTSPRSRSHASGN